MDAATSEAQQLDAKLVCYCYALTAGDIRRAIDAGATRCREVALACDAVPGCGYCVPFVMEMLRDVQP